MGNTVTKWLLQLVNEITAPAKEAEKSMESVEQAIEQATDATNAFTEAQDVSATNVVSDQKRVKKSVDDSAKSMKEMSAIDLYAVGESVRHLADGLMEVTAPGAEFNAQILEVNAITGVAGEKLEMLGEAARQTALDFGGDASAQLNSYKTLLSRLGPEIADVPEAVGMMGDTIQTLSKTMSGDALGATDALTTGMLQFGVALNDPIEAARQMNNMANVMAAGAKYGAAEVPQIGQALEVAGVQAKIANVSFEETNSALQALAGGGRYGSEAGTALRNFITQISAPGTLSKDALKYMKAYKVDLKELSDTAVPFADRLQMLAPLQNDLNALTEIFGRENAAGAQILIRSADAQAELTQKITGTNTATEQADIIMGSFNERMARWGAQLGDIGISIFNATEPMLPFISVGANVLSTVADIAIAGKGLSSVWQWLTKVTWLNNIATKVLTISQTALNAAFVTSPVGWVVAGLAALTAGVMYAWNHFEGFRAVVLGLWETFKQVFNNIAGLFKAVFSPIGEAIDAIQHGNWADAATAVLKLNPVSTAARTFDYIADGGLTKGINEAYQKGAEMGRQSFRNDKAAPSSDKGSIIDAATSGKTPGQNTPTILPATGAGKYSPIEISGASGGGGKSISVTLNVTNNFPNINSEIELQRAIDKFLVQVNDRIKETALGF